MFKNVTENAGIQWTGEKGAISVGWLDFNLDGLPDLWVAPHAFSGWTANDESLQGTNRPKLYLNQGDGTFTDIHSQVFPASFGGDNHGTAWTDFDNDGDPDLFVIAGGGAGTGAGPSQLWVNQGGILQNQAALLGVDFPPGRGRTPLWFDWNKDGLLDLLQVNESRPDEQAPTTLFQQTSNGFENVNEIVGFQMPSDSDAVSAQVTDLFGDGTLDLIVLSDDSSSLKIYETTSPVWNDLTSQFPQISNVRDAAIADFNGDLIPDILFTRANEGKGQYVNSNIFQGDKTAFARLITNPNQDRKEVGISVTTSGSITFDSYRSSGGILPQSSIFIGSQGYNPTNNRFTLSPDNPNDIGILPRTDTSPPGLYIGYDSVSQSWQAIHFNPDNYKAISLILETSEPLNNVTPIGFDQPDITQLGGLSPVLLTYDPQTGEYVDHTEAAGLNSPIISQSVVPGDFDNDGDVDLYLTSTLPYYPLPSIFYENQGDGTFVAINNAAGAAVDLIGPRYEDFGVGLNVATADYDVDGFLDLFVGHSTVWGSRGQSYLSLGTPYHLFHNGGNQNYWLQIDLQGVISNRDAVGTKVLATTGGVTQLREQSGGMHRIGQNLQRLHFGLASHVLVDNLRIEWSSGSVQEFQNIAVNQVLKVVENQGTPGNDLLEGSASDDTLRGLAGNDVISGKAGDDTLIGDEITSSNPFVSSENLVMHLEFEETSGLLAADTSPYGSDNFGELRNGASFNNGLVDFDGSNDYININNAPDINLETHAKRTIALWFKVDDQTISNRKQVLYEEGGSFIGLNLYIYDDRLYVGGWNSPNSGTYLSTDSIAANTWHHVTLVLDAQPGSNTPQAGALNAYLDGVKFGEGEGAELSPHTHYIGVGGLNGGTKFHDGSSSGAGTNGLEGSLDDVRVYNRALTGEEIEILAENIVMDESNDILLGNEGNDILVGGIGNDSLTGGDGSDHFVYDTGGMFTDSAVGIDLINDFTPSIDKIVLDLSTFTAITSEAGEGFSVSTEFAIVDSDADASISQAVIVYNSAVGRLFYNQNGSLEGYGSGGVFAEFDGLPAIAATDFLIQA